MITIKIAFPKGNCLEDSIAEADKLIRALRFLRLHMQREAIYRVRWLLGGSIDIVGVFMRPCHIPELIARGKYDTGICGTDKVNEWNLGRNNEPKLDIWCTHEEPEVKVVLFCAKDDPASGAKYILENRVKDPIASEYPNITENTFRFLAEPPFDEWPPIIPWEGTVEAHVPQDYRFGVCVSETGKTLQESGLRVLNVLYKSRIGMVIRREEFPDDGTLKDAVPDLGKAMLKTKAFAKRH